MGLLKNIELDLFKTWNMLESVLRNQQRIRDDLTQVIKASLSKNENKMREMLESIEKDKEQEKKLTPKDIESVQWLTKFIDNTMKDEDEKADGNLPI